MLFFGSFFSLLPFSSRIWALRSFASGSFPSCWRTSSRNPSAFSGCFSLLATLARRRDRSFLGFSTGQSPSAFPRESHALWKSPPSSSFCPFRNQSSASEAVTWTSLVSSGLGGSSSATLGLASCVTALGAAVGTGFTTSGFASVFWLFFPINQEDGPKAAFSQGIEDTVLL